MNLSRVEWKFFSDESKLNSQRKHQFFEMKPQQQKNYSFRLLKDKPRGHKQIRPNWFTMASSELVKNRASRPLIHGSATKTSIRLDQSSPTREPSVSIVAGKSERYRGTFS